MLRTLSPRNCQPPSPQARLRFGVSGRWRGYLGGRLDTTRREKARCEIDRGGSRGGSSLGQIRQWLARPNSTLLTATQLGRGAFDDWLRSEIGATGPPWLPAVGVLTDHSSLSGQIPNRVQRKQSSGGKEDPDTAEGPDENLPSESLDKISPEIASVLARIRRLYNQFTVDPPQNGDDTDDSDLPGDTAD